MIGFVARVSLRQKALRELSGAWRMINLIEWGAGDVWVANTRHTRHSPRPPSYSCGDKRPQGFRSGKPYGCDYNTGGGIGRSRQLMTSG